MDATAELGEKSLRHFLGDDFEATVAFQQAVP
jgi:hypothetical protein